MNIADENKIKRKRWEKKSLSDTFLTWCLNINITKYK